MLEEQPQYDFSVLMITYNHAHFIEQAVQSVLAQQFNGSLQIVIGVDKSTDDTLIKCQQLQLAYPDKIHLLVHDTNVGMFQNFMQVLKHCAGKYIAILEGDDYWIDPTKLQRQFAYFESHPDCLLTCGLALTTVDQKPVDVKTSLYSNRPGTVFLKEDIITTNRLTTLTTAFRSTAFDFEVLDRLSKAPHLDWGLYLSLRYQPNSYIYRFNRYFGVYRHHSGGVFSQIDLEKKRQNIVRTIELLYQLKLEPVYKMHLQAFFTNLVQIFDLKAYRNEFFQPDQVIYSRHGWLRLKYLAEMYQLGGRLLFRPKQAKLSFKLKWELFKQTKSSIASYFNPLLWGLFPFVALLVFVDHRQKKRLLQTGQQFVLHDFQHSNAAVQ